MQSSQGFEVKDHFWFDCLFFYEFVFNNMDPSSLAQRISDWINDLILCITTQYFISIHPAT